MHLYQATYAMTDELEPGRGKDWGTLHPTPILGGLSFTAVSSSGPGSFRQGFHIATFSVFLFGLYMTLDSWFYPFLLS